MPLFVPVYILWLSPPHPNSLPIGSTLKCVPFLDTVVGAFQAAGKHMGSHLYIESPYKETKDTTGA